MELLFYGAWVMAVVAGRLAGKHSLPRTCSRSLRATSCKRPGEIRSRDRLKVEKRERNVAVEVERVGL